VSDTASATAESDQPSVGIEIDGAVAWLTFQRPGAANAIDLELAIRFREATVKLVSDDTVRVVVIRGNEKFFCAGGDVASMLASEERGAYLGKLATTMHEGVEHLVASDMIIVAAVQGAAAGAGFALVLDADIVLAAPSATFVSAYSQVGLTPDTGFSATAARVVGTHRAKELVLLNRRLDAQTALAWGIVAEIIDSASFTERVREVARDLSAGPFPALSEAKRLLSGADGLTFTDQLADEADTISRMVETPAARERIDAFARRNQKGGTQ